MRTPALSLTMDEWDALSPDIQAVARRDVAVGGSNRRVILASWVRAESGMQRDLCERHCGDTRGCPLFAPGRDSAGTGEVSSEARMPLRPDPLQEGSFP